MSANDKIGCMLKLSQLMMENAAELTALETMAMGTPGGIGGMLVQAGAGLFRYYSGFIDKIAGDTLPTEDGIYKITRREPLGVVAGVGAWNASALLFAWKVAPAIAAGNCIIYKPSEKSPFGLLALGKLIQEAGFPPGVINIVNGGGATGALLASHMKIRKISFTGSTATGRKIAEMAAKSNLKRVTLELGGKSPAIVFDDADMEKAVQS